MPLCGPVLSPITPHREMYMPARVLDVKGLVFFKLLPSKTSPPVLLLQFLLARWMLPQRLTALILGLMGQGVAMAPRFHSSQ